MNISPDLKILANLTSLNTLMISSSDFFFSFVSLLMCRRQKEKVDNLRSWKCWSVIVGSGKHIFYLNSLNLNSFVTVWVLKEHRESTKSNYPMAAWSAMWKSTAVCIFMLVHYANLFIQEKLKSSNLFARLRKWMQNLSIRVYEGANMISKGYLQEVRENITSLTNYPFYKV